MVPFDHHLGFSRVRVAQLNVLRQLLPFSKVELLFSLMGHDAVEPESRFLGHPDIQDGRKI